MDRDGGRPSRCKKGPSGVVVQTNITVSPIYWQRTLQIDESPIQLLKRRKGCDILSSALNLLSDCLETSNIKAFFKI